MDGNPKLSRRSVLKGVALLAGIALAGRMGASREALAQQKASKTTMKYQDTPSGNRQCSNCSQFVPGKSATADGTCKVVEGAVSPRGYCIAWVAKP